MLLKKLAKNRIFTSLLITAFVGLLSGFLIYIGIFDKWHLKIADSLYTYNKPSDNIVIIGIDDRSTDPKALGRFGQWTRENYIPVLEQLKKEQPAVIGFDIIFQDFSRGISGDKLEEIKREFETNGGGTAEDYQNLLDSYTLKIAHPVDIAFAKALAEFSNIVLSVQIDEAGNYITQVTPQIAKDNPTLADVDIQLDPDGAGRRVQPTYFLQNENKSYDDFALAIAKKFLNREIDLPLENGKLMLNFFGDPFSYKSISFWDVAQGNFLPGTFKDKIVLIGITSFKENSDRIITPKTDVVAMTGIEFRANEIQTILDGKFLRNQSLMAEMLTILALSFASLLLLNYLNVYFSFLVLVLFLSGYYLAGHFFFKQGLILNMIHPFAAIILAYIVGWLYKFLVTDKDKRRITGAFGHYVSKDLVDEISKNPDIVKLGGEKRVVTVFFSDLKNSTGLSEKVPIQDWVKQMNEYFSAMEDVVKNHGGTLDKYEGDAIMAIWNAPILEEDHIIRSYLSALEMRKVLLELNIKWQAEGKPALDFRIGINTGEALVGNFGSENRFDYTAMGDTVNTASRLESAANKHYGTSAIVAGFEDKKPLAEIEQKFVLREIDMVILPGKSETIKLYELICLRSELSPELAALLQNYSQGLAAYRGKDFAKAAEFFALCKRDSAAGVMALRCAELLQGSENAQIREDMSFVILLK